MERRRDREEEGRVEEGGREAGRMLVVAPRFPPALPHPASALQPVPSGRGPCAEQHQTLPSLSPGPCWGSPLLVGEDGGSTPAFPGSTGPGSRSGRRRAKLAAAAGAFAALTAVATAPCSG